MHVIISDCSVVRLTSKKASIYSRIETTLGYPGVGKRRDMVQQDL